MYSKNLILILLISMFSGLATGAWICKFAVPEFPIGAPVWLSLISLIFIGLSFIKNKNENEKE